jgi:PIN like domain
MKNKFIEYHIAEHLTTIYDKSTIVLDTNALLNVYRYSKDNRIKYLEILSNVKNRLFLTHNICSEFYKNRYNLIVNRSSFKSIINILVDDYSGKLLSIINNSAGSSKYDSALSILKHEDELRNKIKNEIQKSIDKIKEHVGSFEEEIGLNYIQGKDPILAQVVKIFKDKIGEEISSKEKSIIYKEGEERYKKQIPPGYKDKKKGEPECYGDLIIWKELENLSNKLKKNILFVSDDRKEDWAIDINEMNLGPRKELIKEFHTKTGNLFYSVTTKDFIKIISDKYSVKNTESLERETELIDVKLKKDRQQEIKEMLDSLKRTQEFMKESASKPFKWWQEQQEQIKGSLQTPFEEWAKLQEQMKNSWENPFEEWPIQDVQMRIPPLPSADVWAKQQEDIKNLFHYPDDELGSNQDQEKKKKKPTKKSPKNNKKGQSSSAKKNKKK